MRIFLTILSIIMIIITLYFYFNLKNDLKKKNRITKIYILDKLKIFNILLIVSISLSVITIIYNISTGINRIRKNENIDNYELYINEYIKNDDIHSNLSSFPKNIDKNNVLSFGEYNRDGLFDGSYFIYLRYQYEEELFNKELSRIKVLSNKKIENKDINYIAYIINDDYHGTSEYVLIDETNYQIIYVFNQLFSSSELDINKNFFLE